MKSVNALIALAFTAGVMATLFAGLVIVLVISFPY